MRTGGRRRRPPRSGTRYLMSSFLGMSAVSHLRLAIAPHRGPHAKMNRIFLLLYVFRRRLNLEAGGRARCSPAIADIPITCTGLCGNAANSGHAPARRARIRALEGGVNGNERYNNSLWNSLMVHFGTTSDREISRLPRTVCAFGRRPYVIRFHKVRPERRRGPRALISVEYARVNKSREIGFSSDAGKASEPFGGCSLDESTDLSDTAQLAIFIRGVDKEFTVTEKLLALQPLKGTTTGEDIFNEVQKSRIETFHRENPKLEAHARPWMSKSRRSIAKARGKSEMFSQKTPRFGNYRTAVATEMSIENKKKRLPLENRNATCLIPAVRIRSGVGGDGRRARRPTRTSGTNFPASERVVKRYQIETAVPRIYTLVCGKVEFKSPAGCGPPLPAPARPGPAHQRLHYRADLFMPRENRITASCHTPFTRSRGVCSCGSS
ncbi:General transcription factor II-I repeat domain-containing protein 2A [Eumeta japonica]|uniref:General transcription factor II-I repeat domain-containing protein 2A n=1 Tax=Eumeta variegata TaxID=151549 RepID=A0A4C1U217_EUMVA|nr:General transcription factor II-I repeat domain-containing protein 2A [Eumeta japonica]